MLRRMRGIVGTMLVWALPWSLTGAALALMLRLRGGYQYQRLEAYLSLQDWPAWGGGPIGFFAAAGALVGMINGLLFAAAVATAHRRRVDMTSIPSWHFAGIGAIATGVTAAVVLGMPLALAGMASAVGALSGAAYLWVAKRGERRSIASVGKSASLDAAPVVGTHLTGPQP